jgi:hypothetical protein
MHVLAGAVIKAKLKIPRVELVLTNIMTGRKYSIPAAIGEFKSDNLALPVVPVLPA